SGPSRFNSARSRPCANPKSRAWYHVPTPLEGGHATRQEVDIAVIGAGPAGLMAATISAQAGASVLVLEKLGWAGGRLGLQTQPLQGPMSIYRGYNGIDFCSRLLDDAMNSSVDVSLNTPVSDVRREPQGFSLRCHNYEAIRARAVIISTGSDEPWMEFPGSNLRGVMLSGDAQTRLNMHSEPPGTRVLMIGSDNAGLLIAANLLDAGSEVIAVVDESPSVIGRDVNASPLSAAGVEILTSSRVVAVRGQGEVEAATVATPGDERTFQVDTICLAGPRAPQTTLAAQLGCSLSGHEVLGGLAPVHNRHMSTSVRGVYVCGDASGVENGAASLESGRIAGLSAAEDLGFIHFDAIAHEQLARARLGYLRRGRRGLLRRQAKGALAVEHQRIERGP
ncbi:MAG: FAD-dependent oxidoreductase, partial [Ardenticatenaceae bacterium]